MGTTVGPTYAKTPLFEILHRAARRIEAKGATAAKQDGVNLFNYVIAA